MYHNSILFRCQEVLLNSMTIGKNIARNAALRENVFMMSICVDLRIPLFLVGKPGSSKSLAKAIVADSLTGERSKNDLLKSFKEVSTWKLHKYIISLHFLNLYFLLLSGAYGLIPM